MSDADERVAAILRGPGGPDVAAFFDFDGTLIDGFSATAFLRGAGIPLTRLLGAALGRGPLPLARMLVGAVAGTEPSDRDIRFAHEAALCASRDLSEDELAAVAARVFAQRLAARLRPEMWALAQAHRRMGHRVAVVTAASRWQVEPLAVALGIEHVLCTRSATPLRGGAKAIAVLDFALEHDVDLVASHAYADSGDDVPFLEVCGKPCAVCPSDALTAVAHERGWPVLRLARPGRLGPTAAARSAAAWGGTFAGVATALGLGAAGLDRREAAELGMALASRACLELAGVRVRVRGAEHLAVRPAVFLFNHQSWLDVAVMARLLRRDYTGFAKRELGRVPGLAGFGRMFEVVFIDRGAAATGSDHFRPVLDLLAHGVSVAVAPEGTRSLTPMPGPFHKGAFLAARAARVPLVPVVLRNTGRLMPRGSKTVQAGRAEVVVHPPVDPMSWRLGEFGARIAELRDVYLSTLTSGDWGAR